MNRKSVKTYPLKAEGISKRYPNGRLALDGIGFKVAEGEVFGLLGENGAGKSTLLKILCTLLRPTAGRLELFGRNALDQPHLVRRRLGVVSQEINLDLPLTVHQNLELHCRYFSVPPKVYRPRIAEWLGLLGLDHVASERIYALSGGVRRKVMIARAFLTRPDLLILDEPTAALDPGVRTRVWEKILCFARNGGAVVLSTHHFEEAERLCGRIGLIHKGKLLALDEAKALESRYLALTNVVRPESLQPGA